MQILTNIPALTIPGAVYTSSIYMIHILRKIKCIVHMCSYLRRKHIKYLNKLIKRLYRPTLDCDGTVNIVSERDKRCRKRNMVSVTRLRVKQLLSAIGPHYFYFLLSCAVLLTCCHTAQHSCPRTTVFVGCTVLYCTP